MKKLSYLLLLSLLLTGCKSDDSSVSDENTSDITEYVYDSCIVFSADDTAEDDVIDEISDILSQRLINAYPELNYTSSVDYDLNTIQFDFDMVQQWHMDTAEFLTMPNYLEMRKGDSQDDELFLTNEDINSVTLVFNSTFNEYSITLTMNETGSQVFSDATAELAGTDTPISIWLDDELVSSPTISEYVYGNEVVISGGFTKESAQELAIRMGSAHLPYDLSVKKENLAEITIEPDTITEVKTTQPSTAETTAELAQENSEYNQRQILEAICIDMYGTVPPFSEDDDHVDYLMNTAEYVSEEPLGSIADNEDAIEKAKVVWIEYLGSDYIEKIESDYIEVNGEPMHYERDNPPYEVNYYDEYDVWFVKPNAPSGIREDGVEFGNPGTSPYLIIRGSDGKILGALL